MSKYARIIDIEKLLYLKGFCIGKTSDELYEALSDLPTIDIVHCKDCKHRYDDGWLERRWACTYLKDMRLKDDDFCSYGERKDNE